MADSWDDAWSSVVAAECEWFEFFFYKIASHRPGDNKRKSPLMHSSLHLAKHLVEGFSLDVRASDTRWTLLCRRSGSGWELLKHHEPYCPRAMPDGRIFSYILNHLENTVIRCVKFRFSDSGKTTWVIHQMRPGANPTMITDSSTYYVIQVTCSDDFRLSWAVERRPLTAAV